jgi:hypothetical protein
MADEGHLGLRAERRPGGEAAGRRRLKPAPNLFLWWKAVYKQRSAVSREVGLVQCTHLTIL